MLPPLRSLAEANEPDSSPLSGSLDDHAICLGSIDVDIFCWSGSTGLVEGLLGVMLKQQTGKAA